MCGIAGIITFNEEGKSSIGRIEEAVKTLNHRGPDDHGIFSHNNVALGHTRLAIIDTTSAAAQPFSDPSGRYTIIFNGEIFNFKELRKDLQSKDIQFRSESDTEVLLQLYMQNGAACLDQLNGFFAFAIYDKENESLFIARDRYGIKPLLYYKDADKLIVASEMKTIMAFGIPKAIDQTSLHTYLHLNYIPAPDTILQNVKKLQPGHFIQIQDKNVSFKQYYVIPKGWEEHENVISFDAAKEKLAALLDDSVQMRLISDVPIGAFLSGGIDSSVITALAAKHTKHLNTFSIGYKDEPLFDETQYAQLVAKKYQTNHTVFSLTNKDLFAHLHGILNALDEPFADSSAIAVNILSQHTRKHVTVALSGDGADELFGGYNKHAAELRARSRGLASSLVSSGSFIWDVLPKSRNSAFGNKIRQLQKFSTGLKLSEQERYWLWAGFANEGIQKDFRDTNIYQQRKKDVLKNIHPGGDFNEILYTDMQLVLANDMLTKVDKMSMANSLEVRVPFLDYRVVDFAFSLPAGYKINPGSQKHILKEAFRSYLPEELFHRKKHGFEVPLLKWFRSELKSMITDDLLEEKFILEQGIFNSNTIKQLQQHLFSTNPGDAVAKTWALIVFQYWWKQYIM